MHITVTQKFLAAALARGADVAPKKSAIQILSHVRLVADADGTVAVATTDLDRFAEAHCEAKVLTPGSVMVPAVEFTTLIGKHGKDAEIELTATGGALVVKSGRSKVKLPTLPADDFPAWANDAPLAEFVIGGPAFERTIARVRFAASQEEIRYYLQGLLFEADPRGEVLNVVATDGHRLALSSIPLPEGAEECPRCIVPSEAIDAATRIFKGTGEIILAFTEKGVSFTADGLRLSAKLIDGNFPDYTRIVPQRGQPGITFKRADFVDCLDRANVLAEREGAYNAIEATPGDGVLTLEAKNKSGGEAVEVLTAIIDPGFERFGFNPRYAAQFLASLAVDELTIEQSDPNAPHLFHSPQAPDFTGVLMPVRVGAPR